MVDRITSRAVIGRLYQRLEQGAAGWAGALMFSVASDQGTEEYAWLGMSPAMRQWIGGRQAKGLREYIYSVSNLPWEATLSVLIDDLRRDKTGQLLVRIDEMATRANAHWMRLLSTLIQGGSSTVCYDGQYFFDSDHAEGDSGPQNNTLSVDISAVPVNHHGSITSPSVGEMQHSILQAIQAMYGFKDDQGEPLNEGAMQFMVMVPVPFWVAAASAVSVPVLDGGDSNVILNMDGFRVRVVPNPRLTWTDTFAVFRTDGTVKPFIRQEEVPVEVSAIAEGSELEFRERRHEYGLYASGNAGYGYWQHAVKVTLV